MEFSDGEMVWRQFYNEEPDLEYEWFKEEFNSLTTIQLNFYKEKQMKRRINTLIEKKGIADYREFMRLLQSSPKELAAFVDYITINVTAFFRTPEHWNYVENEIFSHYTTGSDDKIRIWCAACSSGEEPYSVAMCLAGLIPLSNVEIIATDLDETILNKARKGQYDERSIGSLPGEYLNRYFAKKEARWEISEDIKSCIEFRQMDLLKDEYPTSCDMILCRNVLIYFTEEAKGHLYSGFKNSLKEDGYLFTGDTEQIVYHKLYGFQKEKNFLYRNHEDRSRN